MRRKISSLPLFYVPASRVPSSTASLPSKKESTGSMNRCYMNDERFCEVVSWMNISRSEMQRSRCFKCMQREAFFFLSRAFRA